MKKLVKFMTLVCQTKIIKLLMFFNPSNSTNQMINFIFYFDINLNSMNWKW